MVCKKPFCSGAVRFPCGQCLPCRINKNRLWTHRILLEQLLHSDSCFVTLTYSDDTLPEKETYPNGNLSPRDFNLFLKRLRKAVNPIKLRYFGVGEYGERSQRAHYHVIIYGIGPAHEAFISRAWQLGHIHVGDLTKESAQYCCKYIQKKMTNKNNEVVKNWLAGRKPEFARMSRMPGIGAGAAINIATALASDAGALEILTLEDVPQTLRHAKKKLPLGRYLTSKVREAYGFEHIGAQDGWLRKMSEKQIEKFEEVQAQYPEKTPHQIWCIINQEIKQKILQIETRHKIYNKGGIF